MGLLSFKVLLTTLILTFMSYILKSFMNSSLTSTITMNPAKSVSSSESYSTSTSGRTPVYFFSHGGPTFMYENDEMGDKGAWQLIRKIGKFMKSTIKPEAIVVVSGHWESTVENTILVDCPGSKSNAPVEKLLKYSRTPVSTPTEADELKLIYDFYGFPKYMYEEKFIANGSRKYADKVVEAIKSVDLNAKTVTRGIDHGVWVPFKVAFPDQYDQNNSKKQIKNVNIPIIQVSLGYNSSIEWHFKVGQALGKLRAQNILIIGSGMTVHNLRDLGIAMGMGKPMPYVSQFENELKRLVDSHHVNEEMCSDIKALLTNKKELYRKAHPSPDHFLPFVVAAGAAGEDFGKQLYTNSTLSLAWGTYQWGEWKAGQNVKI